MLLKAKYRGSSCYSNFVVVGYPTLSEGWRYVGRPGSPRSRTTTVAAYTRENTGSMTREHKFLSGNRGNLCVKILRSDSTPAVREKTRVDMIDKRRETTSDCKGRK